MHWIVSRSVARLEVADDGRVLRPGDVPLDSYCRVGMHERADAAGAVLTIDSRPENGTRVSVDLAARR